MKTKMKFVASFLLMTVLSLGLYAQQQSGDCVGENEDYRDAKKAWIDKTVDQPLNADQIINFKGLDYYDIDCLKRTKGTLNYSESDKSVKKLDGTTVDLVEYGTISFQFEGKPYEMIVYLDKYHNMKEFKNRGIYFIPFKDGSNNDSPNAKEGTWKDGRYLIIDKPEEGENKVILDFNRAVNSWDAYRINKFSTLKIEQGNSMAAPLLVGERKYEDRTK